MLVVYPCVMGIILWTPSWRLICWRYRMDRAWCTVSSESGSWRERESFEFSEWVVCSVSQNFRLREVQRWPKNIFSMPGSQDWRNIRGRRGPANHIPHWTTLFPHSWIVMPHEDQTYPVTPLSPVVHYTAKRMRRKSERRWRRSELREDFYAFKRESIWKPYIFFPEKICLQWT